jgi:hypothetical protein
MAIVLLAMAELTVLLMPVGATMVLNAHGDSGPAS